jgi:hypothetical protein
MSPFNLANLRALLDSEPTKRMSMTLNYAELESLVITHDRAQRYEAALREIQNLGSPGASYIARKALG